MEDRASSPFPSANDPCWSPSGGTRWTRAALFARHRSRRERTVGPRAVGASLWRGSRDANSTGNRARHWRRSRAQVTRLQPGGISLERRPCGIRRAAADPRSHRAWLDVRRSPRGDSRHDNFHHPHASPRRPRRIPVSSRRKAPGRLLGHDGRQPRQVPGAGIARCGFGVAIQYDSAGVAIGRTGQRGQPAAWRSHPRACGRRSGRAWPRPIGRSAL